MTFIRRTSKLLNPYKGLPKEIYILFIARIINSIGSFIFPLMTLILTKKLGIEKDAAGLWISIAGVFYMLTSVLSGKLTDSFGRKKIVIIFTSLSAFCYLAAGIVGASKTLIPLIIIAGMLSNMAWPAQSAMVADLTVPETRKATYSLFYMGMNIGFAISPLIGGLLFENHLRILFVGDAITTLISTLLIFLFIEETIDKSKDNIKETRKQEKRVEGSIIKVLISRPILIFYALVMFGYNFVYSQWSFLYPIDLEQVFVGRGAILYGRYMGFNAFLVIVLTPVLTAVFKRIKDLKVILLGGILYAVGFGLLGFKSTIIAFLCSTFIITLGEIIVTINADPFVANHTPASHRGRMNSVLPLIMGMGQTLGPLIIGKFITFSSVSSGWKLTGGVMILFSIFMLMLDRYDSKTKE